MIDSLYLPFKHYSDGGSVYIFSDTHFDDEDRELMGYKVSSREQIDILKKTCHKNDTLILLGDVGNPKYLLELKCYKVLILGNHDRGANYYYPYVDEIYEGPLTIAPRIILSHEPLLMPGLLNIHGHNHGGEDILEKAYMKGYNKGMDYSTPVFGMNVAANVVGYKPISLAKVIKEGILKEVPSIHRIAIDNQIERKKERENG